MAPPQVRRIAAALLAWFSRDPRALPWRRTRDPYAIWVSEIMLQQTQVKTVIPYWQRWMRALPTLRSLARAKPEKALKLWEGLGYYRRARNLQKAAQWLVAERGGQFPTVFAEVLALPGVGRYTAGAVCSIAYNQPTPVLDGNVMRVLTRLSAIGANPKQAKVQKHLWALALALVECAAQLKPARTFAARVHPQSGNCSCLNQALMEFGAVICTPRNPRCELCPLASGCRARRLGQTDSLPNLGRRASPTTRREAVFLIEHRGRLLLRPRPHGAVNAHFWEFPGTELDGHSFDLRQAARQALGFVPDALRSAGTLQHTITRYRIKLEVHRGELRALPRSRRVAGRWFSPRQLEWLHLTGATRKLLNRLAA